MSPPVPVPAPPVSSPALAGIRHAFLWLFVYMGIILLLYLILYIWNTFIRRSPPGTAEAPPLPPRRIGGKVVPYVISYGKDCAICLDDYRDGDLCRVLSACKHVYHKACIDKWLTADPHCPLCRGSVRGSVHGSAHGSQ